MKHLIPNLLLAFLFTTISVNCVAEELSINGKRIHFEMAGSGKRIVLIHGGLVDSRMWDPQFTEFSKTHRVIRYDLPGFGKSETPDQPFYPVEDLRALLVALNVKKCALIGVSYGGQVAIEFALAYPEMVEALIPVASALKGYPYQPGGDRSAIFQAAKADRIEESIDLWLQDPIFELMENYPDATEKMRIMLRENVGSWSSNVLAKGQWPATNTMNRLSEISARTLVIAGERDNADILAIADLLAAKIPGARKISMKGTDHHPNMEKPDEFNAHVLAFLQ